MSKPNYPWCQQAQRVAFHVTPILSSRTNGCRLSTDRASRKAMGALSVTTISKTEATTPPHPPATRSRPSPDSGMHSTHPDITPKHPRCLTLMRDPGEFEHVFSCVGRLFMCNAPAHPVPSWGATTRRGGCFNHAKESLVVRDCGSGGASTLRSRGPST